MKKTLLLGALILISGCMNRPTLILSDDQKAAEKPAAAQAVAEPTQEAVVAPEQVIPATYIPAIPCSYPCVQPGNCMRATEPVVLKPRVTETVRGSYHKRRCCPDEPALPGQEDITYIPDAPEIYVIAANRTVNSMQKEAAPFFEQVGLIKVYIDEAQPKSKDLPGGIDKGTQTLKNRFAGMSTVTVTDDIHESDYVINSVADWYDTPTKKVPAIKYDLFLNEKDGRVVGEWSEIVHQAEGDRSWW